MLASKFLERYPFMPDELAEVSEGTLEADDFKKAEVVLFKQLDWNVDFPVAYDFTREFVGNVFPRNQLFMKTVSLL